MTLSPRTRRPLLASAGGLVLSALLLAGCGGDPSKTNIITGKVTIDGEPANGVVLTLHYDSGKTHPIQVNQGVFKVQGVPLGKTTVTFTSLLPPTKAIPAEFQEQYEKMKKLIPEDLPQGKSADIKQRLGQYAGGTPVPLKYTDPKTSDLTWEITGGTNEKNFDLKKE